MYLIRDCYPEYTKIPHSTATKPNNPILKWAKGLD
jgi:hypothetical protein